MSTIYITLGQSRNVEIINLQATLPVFKLPLVGVISVYKNVLYLQKTQGDISGNKQNRACSVYCCEFFCGQQCRWISEGMSETLLEATHKDKLKGTCSANRNVGG